MIENKIKEMIVLRYGSVSRFAEKIKLPYTTVDTILRRGLLKSNVLNVMTICKELGISIDSLDEDNIKDVSENDISSKQLTRREFEYEITSLLKKTDINEQEKEFFSQAINLICSDKD